VSSAAAQVRETFTWRQSFGVDPLMAATAAAAPAVSAATAAPPLGAVDDAVRLVYDESATGKQYVHGVCAVGRPVLYMCPGQQNSSSTRGNLLQLVYSLERAVAAMPPGVEKLTLLIDFGGYSWRVAPSFATQRATLNILQHHYPERLGLAVLWGAPKLFHLAFKAIKPFIDPVTAGKIVFLYPGVAADAARMGELFASDELLAAYGGGSPWVYSNKEYFGVKGGGGGGGAAAAHAVRRDGGCATSDGKQGAREKRLRVFHASWRGDTTRWWDEAPLE